MVNLSNVEIKRKKGESFESFLRRFNKKLIQSGKLLQARKVRFYQDPVSKIKLRESALRRKEMSSKREYLRKIGKLEEFEGKNKSKGRR